MSQNINEEYSLSHDTSNALILNRKKKGDADKKEKKYDARGRMQIAPVKTLSKKQLKKLKVIADRKKSRANRDELYSGLKKHEISADEIKQYLSVAHLGTKVKSLSHDTPKSGGALNSIRGSRKRKMMTEKEELPESSSGPSDSDSDMEQDAKPDSAGATTDAEPLCLTQSLEDEPDLDKPASMKPTVVAEETKPNPDSVNDSEVSVSGKKAVHVPINRSKEIQEERLKLPIIGMEQEIVEAIKYNDVSIICGETGSGKTTQVPQFLYEAGFTLKNDASPNIKSDARGSTKNTAVNGTKMSSGVKNGLHNTQKLGNNDVASTNVDTDVSHEYLIGITEPRRVAAMNMAARVGAEMSLPTSTVSYQIRFEGTTTPETRIKFMTDGVLLKEIQSDFLLTKYAVIIIDEAHERSMYSDILIGLLSRIVPLRARRKNAMRPDGRVLPPLKLVVMSATLRIEDFTGNHLFRTPPAIIRVESRQFPVTIYFNRVTPTTENGYVEEAFKKVVKIHRLLPEGAILIFVSGQREIHSLISKLKKTFPLNPRSSNGAAYSNTNDDDNSSPTKPASRKRMKNRPSSDESGKKSKASTVKSADGPVDVGDNDFNELDAVEDVAETSADDYNDNDLDLLAGDNLEQLSEPQPNDTPLYCLPLYSMLPTVKQNRVFQEPPYPGCRLCVVATNVAETSLTIPGVRYVVDAGKVKNRAFAADVEGLSRFEVGWTSQASANQRAGRAGRTGPGHCYRLYSSAVFADFPLFSPPDIASRPCDELVLQMKDMAILKVVNFPFPTPPNVDHLKASEERLVRLGALERSPVVDKKTGKQEPARVTKLGRSLAKYPILPSLAKILAVAKQLDVLPHAVATVCALSVRELLLNMNSITSVSTNTAESKRLIAKWAGLRAMWASDGGPTSHPFGDFGVLLGAVGAADHVTSTKGDRDLMKFCTEHGVRHKALVEVRKLRRQLAAVVASVGGADAQKDVTMKRLSAPLDPPSDSDKVKLQEAILAGMGENVARHSGADTDGSTLKGAYYCGNGLKDPVFIHPTSVLRKTTPEFVVYREIVEATNSEKKYMMCVMGINPDWLPIFCSRHCRFAEPSPDSPPTYNASRDEIVVSVEATFGIPAWTLPSHAVIKAPMDMDYYRHFAAAFLAGEVFPTLLAFRPLLLASPSSMLKSWAKLQPRTEALLKALVAAGACSRRALEEAWEKNSDFLWAEFSQWLPESKHAEVMSSWPPTDD